MSVQAAMDQLRHQIEGMTVECPCVACKSIVDEERHGKDCVCSGTNHIPDPRFAGLLEVVRECFPMCKRGCLSCTESVRCSHFPNPRFVTRSWEGMPPKALEGSLYHATFRLWQSERLAPPHWGVCVSILGGCLRREGDTREAAIAAVIEALGQRGGG